MWAPSTCPDLRGTQLFTIDCGCSCGHVTRDPVIGSSQNLRSDRGQPAYGLTVASGFWSWFVGLFGVHRQVSLTPPRPLGVRYWWQDQAKQGCGCVTRGQRCFCSWGCGRRWAVVLWTFMEGLRACLSTGWCVLPCPTPRGPTGSQNSTWGVLGRRSWTMHRCPRSSLQRDLTQVGTQSSPVEYFGSLPRFTGLSTWRFTEAILRLPPRQALQGFSRRPWGRMAWCRSLRSVPCGFRHVAWSL